MNPGGVVLMLLGVVALTQIFAGDALKRLKIVDSGTPQSVPPDAHIFGNLGPGSGVDPTDPNRAPGYRNPDAPNYSVPPGVSA